MNIYLSPRVEQIGKLIIAVIAALPSVCCIYLMAASGSPALAIGGGFMLYGTLLLFGKVCSLLYSGSIANGLTDFLLFPKRYLKRAPVIVSRQQGLITRGDYRQAENELLQLQQKHPDSPEVTELLSQLYMEKLHAPDKAQEVLLNYFQNRKQTEEKANLRLALRLTDMLQRNYGAATAGAFLKQELSRKGYSSVERHSLERRHNELCSG